MVKPSMKVLLINPPILSVMEPWYDTPSFTRTALAYLSAYVKNKSSNYQIKLVDAKFERLNFQKVTEIAAEFQPDVVGYTAFTNEIKPAAYQAALIKKRLPSSIQVIGGVHLTAIPHQTMQEFWSFDMGVFGEGEVTLFELLEAIREKKDFYNIEGLIFREGSRLIKNKERHRVFHLDDIPLPDWSAMPKAETYYIQSQRGCPLNCTFCMNPNGKFARKRSIENIIRELNYLIEEREAKSISFGDELFSVNRKHTLELLDAMIAHKIGEKVKWDVQSHVRYVDDELFEKFKKAKVTRVELGVETGDELILKKMGKGTSKKMIIEAFESAKRFKVSTGSFFLLGQPNESIDSMKKTLKFAAEINPDLPMFGLMTPYPGTRVADMAENNEGGYQLLSYDWDEYNKQLGGALKLKGISKKELEKIQIKGYLQVFLYNYRFLDLFNFLWQYRKGALAVLEKMIKGKKISELIEKPQDYEEVIYLYGKKKVHFGKAYEEWKDLQINELRFAKKKSVEA